MENQLMVSLRKNKLLKNVDILKMSLNDIKGKLITIGEGEILYREGDITSQLYLVVSGEINLLKKRLLGRTKSFIFGENGFFGQEEFFEETSRTSTAVALRDTYLICLTKEEVEELIRQSEEVMNNLREPVAEAEAEINLRQTLSHEIDREIKQTKTIWDEPEKSFTKTITETKVEEPKKTQEHFQSISDTSRFEKENLVQPLTKIENEKLKTILEEPDDLGLDIFNEDGILKAEFELPEEPIIEEAKPTTILKETVVEEKPFVAVEEEKEVVAEVEPVEETKPTEEIKIVEETKPLSELKPQEDLNDALFNMLHGNTFEIPKGEIITELKKTFETKEEPKAEVNIKETVDDGSFFSMMGFEQPNEIIPPIIEKEKAPEPEVEKINIEEPEKYFAPEVPTRVDEDMKIENLVQEEPEPVPDFDREIFAEADAQIKALENETEAQSITQPFGNTQEFLAKEEMLKQESEVLPKEIESDDARLSKDELDMILRAAEMVNSTVKIDELLNNIVDVARELTGADRGTLYLVDKERSELWSLVLVGENEREIRLKIGEGLAGHVAKTGDTLNINDVQSDPRFNKDVDKASGYVTKNMICFPIKNNIGAIIGVLQLLNSNKGAFTNRDEEFLAALSVHSAIALQNAELVEKLLSTERVHSLGKMANFLIQDIKKPVLVSKRYAEHLLHKQLPQDAIQILEMLLEQLVQVADLVQTTSSYSEGKTILRTVNVSLNNTLADYASRVETLVVSRSCHVYNEFDKDVSVKVDIKEFFQCYLHIIKNACDAMPEGGSIHVSTKRDGKFVKILVKDSGLGIPDGFSEKIFEPFMSYGKKEGTGLGLAITRKIIEAHNGKINAESTTGAGALFTITLPVASMF